MPHDPTSPTAPPKAEAKKAPARPKGRGRGRKRPKTVKTDKKRHIRSVDWTYWRERYIIWVSDDEDDSFIKFCADTGLCYATAKNHSTGWKEARRKYRESTESLRIEESQRRLAVKCAKVDERIFDAASKLIRLVEGTVNAALERMEDKKNPRVIKPSSLREIGSSLRSAHVVARTAAGKPAMATESTIRSISETSEGDRMRQYRDQFRALQASGENVSAAFLSYVQNMADSMFGEGEVSIQMVKKRKALKAKPLKTEKK